MADILTTDTLHNRHACWRAANDLSVRQVYLLPATDPDARLAVEMFCASLRKQIARHTWALLAPGRYRPLPASRSSHG